MDNQLNGASKLKPNDGMSLFKNMREAQFQLSQELSHNQLKTKDPDKAANKANEVKELLKAPPPPPPPKVDAPNELDTQDQLELSAPPKNTKPEGKNDKRTAVPKTDNELAIKLSGRGPSVDLVDKLEAIKDKPAEFSQVAEALGLDESKLREILDSDSPTKALQLFTQANQDNLVLTDRDRRPLKAEELAGAAGAQLLIRLPLQQPQSQPDLQHRVAQDQVNVTI